jgi:hypothetical protein
MPMEGIMNLHDFFRKGTHAGWVCTRSLSLPLQNGAQTRFRPGQEIYTGDYRWQGADLVLTLDRLLGPGMDWIPDRPQSLSAALAR